MEKIGIVTRARDAAIMTELANIMFDMEDSMVNMHIDNLKDTQITAGDTLYYLKDRGFTDFEWNYKESVAYGNGIINDPKLPNAIINFNGDIYVDNYKRGKIQLTRLQNTIQENYLAYTLGDKLYYNNANYTIMNGETSYNGTTSVGQANSLSSRGDFVTWVNKEGILVSIRDNLYFYPPFWEDEELIGIYGSREYQDGDIDYHKTEKIDNHEGETSTWQILNSLNNSFQASVLSYVNQKDEYLVFDLQTYFPLNNELVQKTIDINAEDYYISVIDDQDEILAGGPVSANVTANLVVGGVLPTNFIVYFGDSVEEVKNREGFQASLNISSIKLIGDNSYFARNVTLQDVSLFKDYLNSSRMYYQVYLYGYINNTTSGISLSSQKYIWTNGVIKYIDLEY